MNILVGTNNKSKIATVTCVMAEFYPENETTVAGIDAPSGVPDTPRDEETKLGAYNRAQNVAATQPDYAIGIESGLVQRYGIWFEEAWACIIINDTAYYGYSSGLPIPQYVLETMRTRNMEHGPAMRHIRANDLQGPDGRDTWGTYSDNLILRDVSLQEALRNALIQTLPSKQSLYNL